MQVRTWALGGTAVVLVGLLAILSTTGSRGGATDVGPGGRHEPAAPESGLLRLPQEDGSARLAPERGAATSAEAAPRAPGPTVVESGIRGRLVDGFGAGVPHGRVRADSRSVSKDSGVDGLGRFEFRVPPGSYQLVVQPKSLPEGWLAPYRQEAFAVSPRTEEEGRGFFATRVLVPPEGGFVDVELRVFRATRVWGMVVGPYYEPVEGTFVRLQSRSGYASSLQSSAMTDEDGRFEMANVYPGRYRTEVLLQETVDPTYHGLPQPPPTDVVVPEGGFLELPLIQVGRGDKRIRGVVLDQDDLPFEGVEILCYLARPVEEGDRPHNWSSTLAQAVTDELGGYELDGLPAEQVKIQIGTDYPEKPLGERKAAFWIPPLEVDLRAPQAVFDVGATVLDESRPFHFVARIEVDASRLSLLRQKSLRLDDIRVRVERSRLTGVHPGRRRASFREATVEVDPKTGQFTWSCETPHDPVVFVLSSKSEGDTSMEVLVEPVPRQTLERTIVFTY